MHLPATPLTVDDLGASKGWGNVLGGGCGSLRSLACTCTCTCTCIGPNTHTCIHSHSHTHIDTHAHTCTFTFTHTHTHIQERSLLSKLFGPLRDRYKERPGGYTRLLRIPNRKGDNALMAVVELVDNRYLRSVACNSTEPDSLVRRPSPHTRK